MKKKKGEEVSTTMKVGGSGTSKPINFRQILPLLLVQFSQAVQVMMLFPMLVFMVQFYGIAGDDHKAVGKYTGILASMFPLTMFLTSFFWGWLSDRVGRKPVVCIGVFAIGTGSILLGFTTNYYMALTIRIVTGLFNNITSMLKCMIAEIAGEHQAKAMAYFSVAWTTGTLLGPSVAGILAMPCQQYGDSFPTCEREDSLFRRYPFLLSFIFFGAFTLFSGVYAGLVVPETLKKKKPLKVSKKIKRVLTFRHLYVKDIKARNGGLDDVEYKHLVETEDDEENQNQCKAQHDVELTMVTKDDIRNGKEQGHAKKEENLYDGSARGTNGNGFSAVKTYDDEESEEKNLLSSNEGFDAACEKGWFWSKEIQISVWLYGMIALFYVAFEELFPLFASAPIELGGLSLASKDVGIFMSIGGGCTIPYTIFLFPRLIKKKGTLWLVKMGGIICMLLALLTPFLGLLASKPEHSLETNLDPESQLSKSGLANMGPLLWFVMTVHTIAIHVTGTNCFASTIMVVNKSAPEEHFGAVNSYGQSIASLARVIGPGAVGYLWTVCGGIPQVFLQVSLPFTFCGLSAFAIFVLALLAPKRLNSNS